jgi:hypothetical protein
VNVVSYQLIIEKDEAPPLRSIGKRGLSTYLPASVTSMTVPDEFLEGRYGVPVGSLGHRKRVAIRRFRRVRSKPNSRPEARAMVAMATLLEPPETLGAQAALAARDSSVSLVPGPSTARGVGQRGLTGLHDELQPEHIQDVQQFVEAERGLAVLDVVDEDQAAAGSLRQRLLGDTQRLAAPTYGERDAARCRFLLPGPLVHDRVLSLACSAAARRAQLIS